MTLHVVVTGAGGFAGQYITRYLSGRGFSVTAIARQMVSESVPALTWRRGDLRDPATLPDRFDALIHCAAEIPARCPDPDELYRRNIDMAQTVFGRTAEAGARTVVFLSSMSVYGPISTPVVTEETVPQDPDPYGRAKREAEDLLGSAVAHGLPSGLSIRLPGTVGKGSHDNFLSKAMGQVMSGQTVVANNPDSLFNNIVYIGDLANFLAEWIKAPRAGYAVTNLAATDPLRLRDVISLLFFEAGRQEKVTFVNGGKPPFLISLEGATGLGYRAASVRESVAAFARDVLSA